MDICRYETEEGCSCTRMLLIESLQEALAGKPTGPKPQEVARTITRRLVPLSETKARNLPVGQLSPSLTLPQADQHDDVDDQDMPDGSRGNGRKRQRQGFDAVGAQFTGQLSAGASGSGGQPLPTVKIRTVDHQVAPMPTAADPIIHHQGLRSAVEGILSGPAHGELLMKSSRVPGDSSDSVTLTVCKTRGTDDLQASSIRLRASGMPGSCHLYLPSQQAHQGATCASIGTPQDQLDGLFTLLISLHKVFQQDESPLPTFHVYHDRTDGIIAFNARDEVWYNAAQDLQVQNIGARAEFWYLAICHEVAHHFVHDHNQDFSSYMSKLVLEYSRGFREAQANLIASWPYLWG